MSAKLENVNNSAVNRRPIVDFVSRGVFDVELLSHLARYGKAVDLIRQTSKDLGRPIVVLDVGCGELWPLRSLVGNPFIQENLVLEQYIAVDIETPDIEFLSKRTPYTFIPRDLTVDPGFPIGADCVDLIICLEFIEHIDKPFALPVLDEMKRVLRPGGKVFFSTPNDDHGREQGHFHIYEWRFAELKEELTNRFTLLDCWGTFMRQNSVAKAARETVIEENGELVQFPPAFFKMLRERFDPTWYRIITAAIYPEAAENVAWLLTKNLDLDESDLEGLRA